MRRLFAIEHLRTMLLLVLVGFPLLGVSIWVVFTIALDLEDDSNTDVLLAWILVAAIGTCAAVTLGMMASMYRPGRHLRDMAALEAGNGWATWQYDETLWAAAKQTEGKRLRGGYGSAYGAAGVGVLALGCGALGRDSDFLAVGVLMIVIAAVVVGVQWAGGSARRDSKALTGEVRIGPLGVLRRPGGYTAFAPIGPLLKVEVVDGPPARLVATGRMPSRGGDTDHRTVDVVVPPGREDEARALAERIDAEVIRGWKHDIG